MNPICCPQCGGLSAYCIRPDGLFHCPECGELLDHRDIDLEGADTWGVASDGTLCVTTDPSHALDYLMEAIEEYLVADEFPDDEYARRNSMRNATDALAAYIDARRLGIKKPEIGYAEESVRTAVNAGADMILGEISLGELEEDVINLVVNAALTSLTNPGASFAEMVEQNYGGENSEDIRSWWGWNK